MKKRGFGEGRWNGFGGKIEAGETIEMAAKRELLEEVSLIAHEVAEIGRLTFSFADRDDELLVHVYHVLQYEGEPVETEEMKPQWFHINEIPYEDMWADDEVWLPYALLGHKFAGTFHFDTPATAAYPGQILEQEIKVVAGW